MFIQNLKEDFYNVLIGKRILVIVNHDLDAICASKILQSLFKYDHIQYTVVPIMGMWVLQNDNKPAKNFPLCLNPIK